MEQIGILMVRWSDMSAGNHIVKNPVPFKSEPPYGECWKFKNYVVYAAYSGYYKFHNDGTVTLDDGTKTIEKPGIVFDYIKTTTA